MRFEVPQFIEIEARIFGPLTWRQFLYLGGGIGMGVVLYLTTNFIVFLLVGLPLGALALALAFYQVNNRPFSFFLEAMFNYFSKHRLYLWRRKEAAVYRGADMASDDLLLPDSGRPAKQTSISSLARQLEMKALQKKDL